MDDERRLREAAAAKMTIATPVGFSQSTCGYCSPPGQRSRQATSRTYGMVTHTLSPEAYQRMIDHGWRRSGDYCYKPDIHASCCPQYTIRLDSHHFRASKNQRNVVRRFARFIRTGELNAPPNEPQPTSFDLSAVLRSCDWDGTQRHRFETTLEPASYSQEKFELYARYQTSIHHDPDDKPTPSSFKRFLCESPIEITPNGSSQPYGSYHELYRLDGKLIAIGVIDILPACVSSVYLIYDPDCGALALGKISALRECARAAALSTELPRLRYYYMGYYIHSCAKMRYKAEYAPSELLDPTTYAWYPFEHCKRLLDINGRSSFAPEDEMSTDDQPASGFLDPYSLHPTLINKAIVIENNTLKRAISSRLWSSRHSQLEVREALAALGQDAIEANIVFYMQ